MSMDIFGVHIEGPTLNEIMVQVKKLTSPVWIVTTNPEILLEARRDPTYAHTLRQADIRAVDGAGLLMLGRLFGQPWSRVTGVELGERLIAYAVEAGLRLGLIGGGVGVAEAVARRLQQTFPTLSIMAEQGGEIALDGSDDSHGEEARHRLTMFAPDILLVALGHPKQERWIARYLADFPRLKVGVGVGGAFDYWAQRVTRAPRFLQKLGLEWLWRLVLEPWRSLRVFRAVCVFPIRVLFDQLVKRVCPRANKP